MPPGHTIRLVLLCDAHGCIESAEGDLSALKDGQPHGQLLPLLVDSASAAKCERFLQRARVGGAFGWELHVSGPLGARLLVFAGLPRADDRLLIAIADNSELLLTMLDKLADQGFDHSVVRNHAAHEPPPPPAIDELSRVNNDLVSLQRELAKRNAELIAITKQRNELLAMAAHDLRNPILVVQGYCDLLGLNTRGSDTKQHELLDKVQHASELMLHVIEDTLEYTRLDTPRGSPHKQPIELCEMLRQIAESYRAMSERKRITIDVECAEHVPQLALDATHLEQILGNLVSNAIKFSNEGTKVALSLRMKHGNAIMAVRDQGPGIAEAELPLLFQPFQTVSARPTAGEPSTGLGLAIVKKLVTANGGKIGVRSRVGEGTTFEVRFALPRGRSPKRAPAPAINVQSGSGRSRN